MKNNTFTITIALTFDYQLHSTFNQLTENCIRQSANNYVRIYGYLKLKKKKLQQQQYQEEYKQQNNRKTKIYCMMLVVVCTHTQPISTFECIWTMKQKK